MHTIEYKVFIPSAGLGTRLGHLSQHRNKAMITVGQKPGIAHIVEQFPRHVPIVVALGHLGDLTRQFLTLAYPDRNITCVEIQKYEGPGSGLGRTLLDCKEHLQCPFIFCSNDTIVREEIPSPDRNWVGFDFREDISPYRTLTLQADKVVAINEKTTEKWDRDPVPYIGLASIHDFKIFWKSMEEGVERGSIETGESYGLAALIAHRELHSIKFTWLDTGNKESLQRTQEALTSPNSPNILPKPNEDIWFVEDRVIKYSHDSDFIAKRVQRSDLLTGFVPKVSAWTQNMYSYPLVHGKVMSSVINKRIIKDFLSHIQDFWQISELDDERELNFQESCRAFYHDKTKSRIKDYFRRFAYDDQEETINGIKYPKLENLLAKVDWDQLSVGTPSRFHGDLHFENIIISEDYHFVLLDWRQDFGGNIEIGDVYYDLAKLLHGMIVSHDEVNKKHFEISVDGDMVSFDILRPHSLVEAERVFKNHVIAQGFDWDKVEVLTALIYLNIAVLHHYPYSEFLFYLGKSILGDVLR